MRVAMPSEEGMIYQHFGHAAEFTVYEVEAELIKNKEFIPVEGPRSEALADFLTIHSVNVVICGNIESGIKSALRAKRIELIPGVTGTADDAIVKYLSGEKMGRSEEHTSELQSPS